MEQLSSKHSCIIPSITQRRQYPFNLEKNCIEKYTPSHPFLFNFVPIRKMARQETQSNTRWEQSVVKSKNPNSIWTIKLRPKPNESPVFPGLCRFGRRGRVNPGSEHHQITLKRSHIILLNFPTLINSSKLGSFWHLKSTHTFQTRTTNYSNPVSSSQTSILCSSKQQTRYIHISKETKT